MKHPIFIFCIILIPFIAMGQREKENAVWITAEYEQLIEKADSLYRNKEYLKSAQAFSKAFTLFNNKGTVNDRYNAACSWALAGNKDSAFYNLFKVSETGQYTNLTHILNDSDLNSLHSDKRWNRVVSSIKFTKQKEEKNFDKALVKKLDAIFNEDQKYRMQLDSISNKFGFDSEEVKKQWQKIAYHDSINLITIKNILDSRGWPGPDIIGEQGNLTLFLVIQHADKATRQQYLPMIREAVKKGNANPSDLALMEDRAAMEDGKRQIYGSQLMSDNNGSYFVVPVEDPDNLDKRRKSVGLPPMQEYLNHWNLKWDVEEYKKKLPEVEEYLKNVKFR